MVVVLRPGCVFLVDAFKRLVMTLRYRVCTVLCVLG